MERLYHPACGAYTSFGIAAYSTSHGRHRKLRFISDVSVEPVRVLRLAARCTRREALLAQREAQLEKEQAELAAAKAQSAERKKTLLDNNDPNFVNPKEKLYDKFPLTVHQMDIIIGVLFALILLFLVLGMTHTSFFGLFGG